MIELELRGYVGTPTFSAAIVEALPPGDVHIVVESDGGDHAAALACYRAILKHRGNVTVEIAGAGSAASLVAMAAARRSIHKDGWLATHSPWSVVLGHPHEIRGELAALEAQEQALAMLYSRACGQSEAWALEAMRAERVFNAGEALEYGLVTEIVPTTGRASTPPRGATATEKMIGRLRLHIDSMRPGLRRRVAQLALSRLEHHARVDQDYLDNVVTGLAWDCPKCGRDNFSNPRRGCAWCPG